MFRLYARGASASIRSRFCVSAPVNYPLLGKVRNLSTQEYHEVADATLDRILSSYEDVIEKNPQVDIDLSQGVLTLEMPPVGTYVINKQPPNKQIWLSSPLSGPKRYDFVNDRWTYLRDNSSLGELLKQETWDALETELNLDVK